MTQAIDPRAYWEQQDEQRWNKLQQNRNQAQIDPLANKINLNGFDQRLNTRAQRGAQSVQAAQIAAQQRQAAQAKLEADKQAYNAQKAQNDLSYQYQSALVKQRQAAEEAEKKQRAYLDQYGRQLSGSIPNVIPQQFQNGYKPGGQVGGFGDPKLDQLANWARQAGWAEKDIPMAVSIAMAESGGNPLATHGGSGQQGIDRGIMQINDYWQRDKIQGLDLTDPVTNFKVALQAYNEAATFPENGGNGWKAWSTFNNGAYRNFLRQPAPYVAGRVQTPGRTVQTENGLRQSVVSNAYHVVGLGTPYVWGGEDLQNGVDCSGLVQAIYSDLGISLPRTANEQATMNPIGHLTRDINSLSPGDLVAWNHNRDGMSPDFFGHISIYIGNGQIIEAQEAGTPVHVRSLSTKDMTWGFGVHLSLPGDQ